jgi:hypothetical protein
MRGFLKRLVLASALVVGGVGAYLGADQVRADANVASGSFCGACTKNSDCGVGFRCCRSNCPKGKYKCLQVSTCP